MAPSTATGKPASSAGFTLIELLVVLAIIATLLTIAAPRYFNSIDKSREAVLRTDLAVMREAIDKHHGDFGSYPGSLDDLVRKRYLRSIPVDPITERADSWVAVAAPADSGTDGVWDVKSGAPGNGSDGRPYAEW
jgi:general secretion pathway protein G